MIRPSFLHDLLKLPIIIQDFLQILKRSISKKSRMKCFVNTAYIVICVAGSKTLLCVTRIERVNCGKCNNTLWQYLPWKRRGAVHQVVLQLGYTGCVIYISISLRFEASKHFSTTFLKIMKSEINIYQSHCLIYPLETGNCYVNVHATICSLLMP